MYEWAPVVVFLGGSAVLCYIFDAEFRKGTDEIYAEFTQSAQVESRSGQRGDERNNIKVLPTSSPRGQGLKN